MQIDLSINQFNELKENLNLLNIKKTIEILENLNILCDQKVQVKIQYIGTSNCQLCDIQIQISDQYLTSDLCKHSYHCKCIQDKSQIISQNLRQIELINFKCKCEKIIPDELIVKSFDQNFVEQIRQQDYINQEQIRIKQERQQQQQKYDEITFDCDICCETYNQKDQGVCMYFCEHQFCKDCFVQYIQSEKQNGIIECISCKNIDVDKRKFFVDDRTKDDIKVPLPIIESVLSKEEFNKLIELWNQLKFNDQKGLYITCPGWIKKLDNEDQDPKIDQQTLKKIIIDEDKKGLQFDITNCTNKLIKSDLKQLRINTQRNFPCKVCGFSFCLLCGSEGHVGDCEKYIQWKKDNKNNQEDLDKLLLSKPKQFKRCPNKACGMIMEKIGGCNHVTCHQGCQKHICWICCVYFNTAKECYAHIDAAHKGQLYA